MNTETCARCDTIFTCNKGYSGNAPLCYPCLKNKRINKARRGKHASRGKFSSNPRGKHASRGKFSSRGGVLSKHQNMDVWNLSISTKDSLFHCVTMYGTKADAGQILKANVDKCEIFLRYFKQCNDGGEVYNKVMEIDASIEEFQDILDIFDDEDLVDEFWAMDDSIDDPMHISLSKSHGLWTK